MLLANVIVNDAKRVLILAAARNRGEIAKERSNENIAFKTFFTKMWHPLQNTDKTRLQHDLSQTAFYTLTQFAWMVKFMETEVTVETITSPVAQQCLSKRFVYTKASRNVYRTEIMDTLEATVLLTKRWPRIWARTSTNARKCVPLKSTAAQIQCHWIGWANSQKMLRRSTWKTRVHSMSLKIRALIAKNHWISGWWWSSILSNRLSTAWNNQWVIYEPTAPCALPSTRYLTVQVVAIGLLPTWKWA